MTKRAPLTFEGVAAGLPERSAAKSPGRPIKRPEQANEQIFAMTLRMPGSLRRSLRRAADDATDKAGAVVSVHDVILTALEKHLGDTN
jgi:hypothetical protein